MDLKVIFNFQHHIETKQEEIKMFLPPHEIPKEGFNINFNYELAADLKNKVCVVSEIQYNYYKAGLDHIVVYLKANERRAV